MHPKALNRDDHDVAGAIAEHDAVKHLLESFYLQLETLRRVLESLDSVGMNIRFGLNRRSAPVGTGAPTLQGFRRVGMPCPPILKPY